MGFTQKILIVDDKSENLFALEQVLKQLDVTIIKALNGNEALIAILNYDFTMAILDVQMPDMDGYELAEFIRSEDKTRYLPVIFLSAVFSDEFHVFKGYQSGAVDFITKPFNPDILINKVKIFLELDLQRLQIKENKDQLEDYVVQLNITNSQLKDEISTRVETENKLRENEKKLQELNATKDKFFSIVAHDLKNPFNTLLGFSDLLLKGYDYLEEKRIKNFHQLIHNASKRGYNLLENLLEWSRSQTGRIKRIPSKFFVKNIINENINLLNSNAKKKNITLKSDVNDELTAFADINMLTTVIRNLVSNALKFTNSGGSVCIKATDIQEVVQIAVTDTGIGISDENIEKLFRIDVTHSTSGTENEAGTGLGLILCKEFVEKNHGQIWVESEKGSGSSFIFTLPKHPHPDDLKLLESKN